MGLEKECGFAYIAVLLFTVSCLYRTTKIPMNDPHNQPQPPPKVGFPTFIHMYFLA